MKYIFYSLFLTFFIHNSGICQINVSGKITNFRNDQPIAYANIGILNTEVGTLSNSDGTFSITIPEKYKEQSLIFSSIGFTKKKVSIQKLRKSEYLNIVLDENIIELNTVSISAKRVKKEKVKLGNGKSLLLSGQLYMDTATAGSAMALLIDKKNYPDLTYIKNVSLYIAKNKFPTFKIRLRFLEVDSLNGNIPGKDIIQEQIITTSTITKGWLAMELPKSYRIENPSFYIMFEWILEQRDRQLIADRYNEYFEKYPDRVSYDTVIVDGERIASSPKISVVLAGTIFGTTNSKSSLEKYQCYYRTNSFGAWKKSTGVLSAKIEMSNYLPDDSEKINIKPCGEKDLSCQINNWAEKFRENQAFPGFQIAVNKADKLIFSKGYGYASLTPKNVMTPQTQLRIASVSKTMTSAALLKLSEDNLIDLDAAVQTYVPSFPKKEYPITVRQLAGHLGGIKNYNGKSWDEIFIQKHYPTLTAATSLFKEAPLAVKPGTKFRYSSYGYMLLGAVIENVSGKSYLDYLNSNFWKPLNMLSTYGDISDSVMINKSKFYYLSGEEAIPYNLSYSYSTGGLLSTSEDLVKFASALISENKLLRKDLKESLFTTQFTDNNIATNYGLGWYLTKDKLGQEIYYHTGELPSSGSIIFIHPKTETTIAILANAPIVFGEENGLLLKVQELLEMLENE